MKTMQAVTNLDAEFITHEQRVVSEMHQNRGADIYIEGPYLCTHTKKSYGYVWVSINKRLLKIDGLGYDVKMQCEVHPKIL